MNGASRAQAMPPALTNRVIADAKRALGDLADEQVIERLTRDALAELSNTPIKVTTFIPVLTIRRVRDLIALQSSGQGGSQESPLTHG